MQTANIIGSGPNGLAAAITLARAGVHVTVYEARDTIGGACSTADVTLPGFHHDLGSSCFPMGAASPFLRSLPLKQYGFHWIEPEIPVAHPLDDGTAVCLQHDMDAMAAELGELDAGAWRRLLSPVVRGWDKLVPELLGPVVHWPRHPLLLAGFGLPALLPATILARTVFRGERARALFAGCAAHSVLPLTAPLSSAIGLVLTAAGHTTGWPVSAGGSQALSDALAAHLHSLGGEVYTGILVKTLADVEPADATLFDTSARALEQIAADRLSASFRRTLRHYPQAPGIFKIDWALSAPIPWRADNCRSAGTVHVGGTIEEIAAAEAAVFEGRHHERPFLLLVQPSVCDPSRAPAGMQTAWGYCHVPNGSTLDRTKAIESQIERFAPGFRDCILARRSQTTAELEAWDPNLIGGDVSGGGMAAPQLVLRPTFRTYRTSDPAIYLCSSYTPPGGGVHGMCGNLAAKVALRQLGRG